MNIYFCHMNYGKSDFFFRFGLTFTIFCSNMFFVLFYFPCLYNRSSLPLVTSVQIHQLSLYNNEAGLSHKLYTVNFRNSLNLTLCQKYMQQLY